MQTIMDIAEGVRGSQGTVTIPTDAATALGLKLVEPCGPGAVVVSCEELVDACDCYEDPKAKKNAKGVKKAKTDDKKKDDDK
jgi:hypothetical protein